MPIVLPHGTVVDMRDHLFSKVGVFDMTMPNWDDPNDPYSDDGEGNKPNPVRERMRKLEKENKELKEAHEKTMQQLRQSTVATVLKAKQLHPKVAALVPENVEPTDEAIGRWLEEYVEVFVPSAPAGEGEEKPPEGEPNPVVEEHGKQMGRIAEATQATQIPTSQADLAAKLASKDLKHEELLAMINKAGGGFGSG